MLLLLALLCIVTVVGVAMLAGRLADRRGRRSDVVFQARAIRATTNAPSAPADVTPRRCEVPVSF
jgi:hypothetical protein